MSRRRFMGSPSSLNPIIAPDNFDPTVQDVNIYKIYTEYTNTDKACGYSFSDSINTLTLSSDVGVSYYYGYRRSGIDYTFTVNSIVNPFIAGDTKRFVIVNSVGGSVQYLLPNGSLWGLYGNKSISIGGGGTTLKYLHYIGNCRISSIPANSFQNNQNLTGNLTIPTTINSIGSATFYNCTNLNGRLSILSNNISFSSNPFCATNLIMNDQNGINWEIFDNILYNDITRTSLNGTSKVKSGGLTIPTSVTSIGVFAFQGNINLTGNLVIPNSIITINTQAFHGCTGFNGSLTIGSSVTTIGTSAFNSCSSLTGNLIIPSSVISIGVSGFQSCTGFNGGLTIGSGVTTIGVSAFQNCSNLTGNLIIPSSVTSIGASSFQNCTSLTGGLTIPSSVTSVGTSAFQNCSNLTGNLILPNTSIVFGLNPFVSSNLILIDQISVNWEIFDSVLYNDITRTSLNGTSKIKSGGLSIPNSVTSIGQSAFYNCANLTGNLIIPNSVTTIGMYAFQNCTGFNGNLLIGSGVVIINDYAVASCLNLTGNLIIPNSVTTIGAYAFSDCRNLTGDLTIGVSTATIGTQAFRLYTPSNGKLNINCLTPNIGAISFSNTVFTELNLASGYNPSTNVIYYNYTFNFSNVFTTSSLNQSIINITSGTKTVTIGATNISRLLTDYPNAISDALARGITIV